MYPNGYWNPGNGSYPPTSGPWIICCPRCGTYHTGSHNCQQPFLVDPSPSIRDLARAIDLLAGAIEDNTAALELLKALPDRIPGIEVPHG